MTQLHAQETRHRSHEARTVRVLRARMLLLWVVLTVAALAGSALAATKREPQEYGGAKRAPSARGAFLWVPRVLLFPPWLVSEYLVRRPIGALISTADRQQWPVAIVAFFTFGERNQITLFPSALFDFGLKPSVGFNFGWDHFLAEPNTLRVHFGTWGPDWISTKIVDRYSFGHGEALAVEGRFVTRKDLPFYGMGPRSPSELRFRYQATTAEVSAAYEQRLWRSSHFSSRAGFRALDFGDGTCCGAQSVQSAVADGTIAAPPGLNEGYAAGFEGLTLVLDSRKRRPESGTGVRVEAHGEAVFAPSEDSQRRRSWVSYGGLAAGFIDVWGARTVGFGVTAELADPLLGTIPFTDQVSLGGARLQRGYLSGRLIDRSAVVATLQYTWPVWVFLDGVIHAGLGNVFGEHFEGFDIELMRLSTGIGLRSNGERDSGFELLVAGATDPLESGLEFSAFRLVIGSHHGF